MVNAALYASGHSGKKPVMTNQQVFQARIAPAIPGLSAMSDLEAFSAIGQFCHRFCDLAMTHASVFRIDGGCSDLASNLDKFEKNQGGVWCAGAALMCAQMLNASGRVNKAWYYADGIPVFTHATALATVDGVLYQFDPYLNGEYTDDQGQIMPYLSVLQAIKRGHPPAWRQFHAEKSIHVESVNALENYWNLDPATAPKLRLKLEAPGAGELIGRAIVTASQFQKIYMHKELVDDELIKLGYPADPEDQLWHYLRLHPIKIVNSFYGDPDDSGDRVLSWIRAVS